MKNIKKYIIIFIISLIVLYMFSTSTSPLYENYYEDDSSIFILMGKAIVNGLTPYKDIFDHKGPIFFWIQALGQKIYDGRLGIFFVQVINLSITNILFYNIAKKTSTNKKPLISILFAMSIFTLFLEEGNLTEEFSLFFITACLYIAIVWIKSSDLFDKKIYKYAFFYGACFSIISLIRLNNAATIIGLLLGIIMIFIKNNKIKELFKTAIFFMLGVILIYVPVLIYFYSKSALTDMIYGTFIHNFRYLNQEGNIVLKFCYSLHILMMYLFTIKEIKKDKNLNILVSCATIVTYIILFVGPGYSHYYLLTIPLIVVYFPVILNIIDNKQIATKMLYLIILFVSITYMLIGIIKISFYIINIEKATIKQVGSFVNQIPKEEKDKVFIYNISFGSSIYLYSDLIPCYKYAFLQNKLIKTNNKIEDEMYEYMQENDIEWIIGYNLSSDSCKNKIEKYIVDNYKKVDSTDVKMLNFLEIIEDKIFLYKKLDKDNNK